ncbi:uncharacterized protein [Tenebrio molitor]|uniref:uncharacterized protein n=1 Tax=Tenebrio molitor TaxID=7067 RepID=UPI0036249783
MDVYIWIITFCVYFPFIQTLTCKREEKCKIIRVHNMKGADCYKMDLENFTQCLPSDVEIIDLSHNRIRKLTETDLEKYSKLKMLYLHDNFLGVIDDESFKGKDYLQTIDLSKNGLTKLPLELFNLPSLQTLYLGKNLNINIVDAIEKVKPVTSPLFHLDISYIMSEEPNELPDLGVLPFLEKYNISGNKLLSTTTKHFAGLCRLKLLDTTNVSIESEQKCDCWTINRWLKNRNVKFTRFECSISESECAYQVPLDDLQTYSKCQENVQENLQKAKTKTILLIVLPIVGVIVFVVLVYFIVRLRRQKRKQNKRIDHQSHELMLTTDSAPPYDFIKKQ